MIDTFFIGSPRTGTTKMIDLLSKRSETATSTPKELKYFCINYKNEGENLWRHYHKVKKAKMIYCNPIYVTSSYVRDRIHLHNPNAKIIMGVTNPIKRIISHWAIFKYTMPVGRVDSFWNEIDLNCKLLSYDRFRSERDFVPHCNSYDSSYAPQYIECSMYYTNYCRYKEKFKDILVYDLRMGMENSYNQVCDFIGIEKQKFNPKLVHDIGKYTDEDIYEKYYREFQERYPSIVHMLKMEMICLESILCA